MGHQHIVFTEFIVLCVCVSLSMSNHFIVPLLHSFLCIWL
ncbi:hypothetical protein V6Z11_A03G093800 [Gossypium hirsutum]